MSNARPVQQPPRAVVVEDGTKWNADTNWFMAVFFFAAAIGVQIWFRLPLNFDFDSRDFNPLVLVAPFLAAVGLYFLAPAIRNTLVHRKFGKSVLEMEGEAAELGGTLKGRIRTARPLAPTGDYEVRVQCVETITRRSTNMKEVTTDHVRWEAMRKIEPGSVDAQEGIPVEFAIPQKALALGDERAQGAVRWIVDVKAPLPGTDFYAIFPLVVRPRKA